jgi:predicted HAD superfamily Cof-like phosphohydrolase
MSYTSDVEDFHLVFGQPVLDKPSVPVPERVALRADLLDEEFIETMHALGYAQHYDMSWYRTSNAVDLVKLADGLADLIYVAIGCALEFGIPLDRVWAEVHRTNMAKVYPDGTVHRRDDGKVLKPDGWRPPDLRAVLGI